MNTAPAVNRWCPRPNFHDTGQVISRRRCGHLRFAQFLFPQRVMTAPSATRRHAGQRGPSRMISPPPGCAGSDGPRPSS